ncbi:hypothetical protein HK100_007571, partial [Physocladia obscura]
SVSAKKIFEIRNDMASAAVDTKWFKEYTGITDDAQVAALIEQTVTTTSASHHLYKCIEARRFVIPKVQTHPVYAEIRARFTEPDFRLLELGCCYGTDARKMLSDGLPPPHLTVSDLHGAYFDIGNTVLYADSDPLEHVGTWFGDLAAQDAAPAHFRNAFTVVSAQMILHVFSAQQCRDFLGTVLGVLKPGDGAVLFGTCVGAVGNPGEWGVVPTKGLPARVEATRFWHSAESLRALLEEIGFVRVSVEKYERPRAAGAVVSSDNGDSQTTHLAFSACFSRCQLGRPCIEINWADWTGGNKRPVAKEAEPAANPCIFSLRHIAHTGIPSHVTFARGSTGPQLTVASIEANTLAVLNPASGAIVWRQHFAENDALLFSKVVSAHGIILLIFRLDVVTVSFHEPTYAFHVRTWNQVNGFLVHDIEVASAANLNCARDKDICSKQIDVATSASFQSTVFAILPGGFAVKITDSKIEWQTAVNKGLIDQFSSIFVAAENIIVIGKNLETNLLNAEVLDSKDGRIQPASKPLLKLSEKGCFALGNDGAIICNVINGKAGIAAFVAGSEKVFWVNSEDIFSGHSENWYATKISQNQFAVTSGTQSVVVSTTVSESRIISVKAIHNFEIISRYDKSFFSATEGDKSLPFVARLHYGNPKEKGAILELISANGNDDASFWKIANFSKRGDIISIHLDTIYKDDEPTLRLFTIFEDGTVSLLQPSKNSKNGKNKLESKWTNDESLAHIVDAIFVNLPDEHLLSLANDELHESVADSEKLDILARYIKRWKSHIEAFQSFVSTLPDRFTAKPAVSISNNTVSVVPLHADRLGFRKLLILATTTGKLHAIETEFGRHVWTRWLGTGSGA